MNAPEIAGLTDLALVSEGNTFTIWKARQASLDRDVEVLQFSEDLTEAQVAHQVRMARLLAKLNHGAILHVFDVNPDATPPYILAEYCDAPSLCDLVEANGPFSAQDALRVASGVAEALAYACTQSPLIVRNLKPQNIHLDAAGNLKLTDFSLAIIANDPDDGPAIDGDDLVGTPNFVSPEHAVGSPDIDPRSDMYSLGMVLYYLVTRKVPFDIPDPLKTFELQKDGQLPNPREANPLLTPAFVALLSRLTMKAPQHRYATWGDALADIRRLLAGKAPSAVKLPPDANSTIAPPNSAISSDGTPLAPGQEAKGKKRRRHPFAWLLLLLWLAWLANCRMGNPLHLPEKFAPQIAIPVLDTLIEKVAKPAAAPGTPDDSDPDILPEDTPETPPQIPPDPYARISEPKSHTTGDPLEDSARPQEPTPNPSVAGATPQTPPATTPSDDSSRAAALAAAIGGLVREGDLAAAKAKCEQMGTPEAAAAAEFLSKIPSPEDALAAAVIAKQGQYVSLRYMGKWRTVTPVRLDGSTLVVKFTDQTGLTRDIPLSLSKIDAADKVSFLNRWATTPEQHAATAIFALQTGDEWTFRRHAAEAGPLAAILAPRP